MLAPLVPHRNIFCVGKNYAEHAAEFAASGFDATGSADGQHLPEYPVVFTKPAATVIATGDPIDPHTDITSALDYEGEIGVIIGKRASKVSKADALDYVWGYTLINDMTARDLQRDHKQWFIGKSLDTFCPLGPWAVTADEVDITNLQLQTRVNGELRQDTNTALLIFDVPTIIETLSAGITLEPGDVIATGTPVGVGIGFDPPKYLQPGDEVRVTATGLGELHNVIADPAAADPLVAAGTHRLFVEKTGSGPAVVLIHGLGGATTVYEPQVAALAETHTVMRYDLSGHGRSPYAGAPSIDGWVAELVELLDARGHRADRAGRAFDGHPGRQHLRRPLSGPGHQSCSAGGGSGAARAGQDRDPGQGPDRPRRRHVRRRRHHPRRGAVEGHPHRSARLGRRGP